MNRKDVSKILDILQRKHHAYLCTRNLMLAECVIITGMDNAQVQVIDETLPLELRNEIVQNCSKK